MSLNIPSYSKYVHLFIINCYLYCWRRMWDWFKILFFLSDIHRLCQYFQRFAYHPPPIAIFFFSCSSYDIIILHLMFLFSFLFFCILFYIYRYIGSTDEQQLARSYSFEIRPNNIILPSVDNISPAVRYPTFQQMNRQENITEKPLRSSSVNVLVNSAMIGSQISLPNRKVTFFFFFF